MLKDDALILLVEDEPTLQFVFERQLQKLGYKVAAVADNGLTAVEMVLAQEFHIVFMDVKLPGMDGVTATTHIRSAERGSNKHTKIVGMTAFPERQRCLESGMDDFLQKPVFLEQLGDMIEKWLNSATALPLHEADAISAGQFKETASRLNAIRDRIVNLRKRVGLDTLTDS